MKNKKASTAPTVKAEDIKKNNFTNNSIPQNTKKDTKKENKNNTGKGASANVNNNFTKYEKDELENMIRESQSERLRYRQFKPNY